VSAEWLGIDVGGTKLLGVRVDERGRVLAEQRVATRREEGPAAVLGRCMELARELAGGGAPRGLGLGFAGLVEHAHGRVSSSIMLPGWDGIPVVEMLRTELGLACVLENDANAAGYGEWVARGSPANGTLVVLTIGTGIGGALVIDGKLHRGARGVAGEIGNMSIDWNGPRCWCGSRGCLNMLASGSALSARYAELARREPPSVPELAREAEAGNACARQVLDEGAAALGAGLANVIQLLNPERISLGGGVAELGDAWLERVRAEAGRRAFREGLAGLSIERCLLGERSGAVGAAALVRDAGERR
jgi:glucokinase